MFGEDNMIKELRGKDCINQNPNIMKKINEIIREVNKINYELDIAARMKDLPGYIPITR